LIIKIHQRKRMVDISEREEQVGIETFVTQLAVEAFDVGILHGLPGPDKIELDLTQVGPGFHLFGHEL
jgi:hypothetical protein